MAGIFDWSTVASENTSIDSINTAPGMPVGNTDNVFRSVAALVRQSFATALEGFLSGASGLPVANGGTGATSAANARTNLGLGSVSTEDTVPISKGGTGAITAVLALTNLGFSQGTNANGSYLRVPLTDGNYFYLQYGTATSGYNGWSSSYTLPVACSFGFTILATSTATRAGAADGNSISAKSVSTSQYQIGNDDSDYCPVNWFAIGVSNS